MTEKTLAFMQRIQRKTPWLKEFCARSTAVHLQSEQHNERAGTRWLTEVVPRESYSRPQIWIIRIETTKGLFFIARRGTT